MWSWLCCSQTNKEEPKRHSRKLLKDRKQDKKSSNQQKTQPSNEAHETLQKNEIQKTIIQPIEQIIQKVDVYKGQQMNGVPHGTGIMNYINGDYYKGEWVNGEKEGKGEQYYFQLRLTYNGQWKHNVKNGVGRETQAHQSYFQGEFRDGVRHGKGTYFDKQKNVKYAEIYQQGNLKQQKLIGGNSVKVQDQFPTLKLDKQRFDSDDLAGFQQKNPQIKELDLQFLLKYYGLKKIVSLQFIDTPISEWTIKQVHMFLEEINLQQYKANFYDNKIKGKDLVQLTEEQMKQDLHMKLGDRKILKSYIQFLNSICKDKKKQIKKKTDVKRRNSLSVKKKKESLMDKMTKSIQQPIIAEDEEWNQGSDQQSKESKQGKKSEAVNKKTQYETENWEKYVSRDNINLTNYHSQLEMQLDANDKTSQKTEKGSEQARVDDVEVSPIKRKKSEDNKQFVAMNSQGGSNPHINLNNGAKKQRSSSSSQSSEQQKQQNEEPLKIKRKKTSLAQGPSQQIRQLYEFLRENQSLDFIIKQKDIEIIEPIGEGGYGKVSRGKYMQCPVAVKDYMKAGRSHKSRQQFMKQVHILSDLKHPNIVLYMGLCITVNRYQLVTEYMQNGSLYDQLHIKKKKFTSQQQLEIIDDIVQGMVYLHNMKNMQHRDLKSSNVLIAEDYKVKLCDFGLSGHKNKNKKQKKSRIGTYQWMAPQVIRNEGLDNYSDVYSFGVILWQILTEQIPYFGMSEAQIIGEVGYDKNHQLSKPPKGCDQFIISIMDKCLKREPSQRPTFIQIQRLIKQERNNRPPVRDVWNIL